MSKIGPHDPWHVAPLDDSHFYGAPIRLVIAAQMMGSAPLGDVEASSGFHREAALKRAARRARAALEDADALIAAYNESEEKWDG